MLSEPYNNRFARFRRRVFEDWRRDRRPSAVRRVHRCPCPRPHPRRESYFAGRPTKSGLPAQVTEPLPMSPTTSAPTPAIATPVSSSAASTSALPSLDELWMPFTANRAFKRAPRLLVAAKDMHYIAADGRQILDGTAGLWCVNAGHCRDSITAAIREQAGVMDYAPPFQMGHPLAFELAE